MLIGLLTVVTSGLIGTTLGVLGGFFGGKVDDAVLFAITCRLAMPVVLVALAVVGLLGLGLSWSSWCSACCSGTASPWSRARPPCRCATWITSPPPGPRPVDAGDPAEEILPNIASHLAVVATLEMALAILLEAALSFLGLGVPPPLPSWGLMIAEGKDYMFFSPWVIFVPGWRCSCWCFGINLLGRRPARRCCAASGRAIERRRCSTSQGLGSRHPRRRHARAVRGASFTVARGETHCIVGESGCGKSVTALAVMGLLAARRAAQRRSLAFDGEDLLARPNAAWRRCAATAWR